MLKKILQSIIPRSCLICEQGTRLMLCDDCESSLPWQDHTCPRCGKEALTAFRKICETCLVNPPPFHQLYSLYRYVTPIPTLIKAFKFNAQFGFGRLFARQLVESIPQWYLGSKLPEVVIPVPTHWSRYQERGFNPVEYLLRDIQSTPGFPPVINILSRKRSTLFQNKLSLKARERNLKNAFIINTDRQFKHVALFDDIVTTGATVNEITNLLKQAGVKKIDIWCIARV